MSTRFVSFAGCSIAVEYDNPTGKEIAEFLFRDIGEYKQTSPEATFSIEAETALNTLKLLRDSEEIYSGNSRGILACTLMDLSLYHLANNNKSGLLLHAGSVSCGGEGMLLPGKTGSGKTTLTAWLLHKGLNYLSDELAFVSEGSQTLESFTRPLNIKTPALAVLKDEFNFIPDQENSYSRGSAYLIPHRIFNAKHQGESPELKLIIFPRFQKKCGFQPEALSKAQAGLMLMECLINARNLPGHGFPEVTRLVKTVPAYVLRYSNFNQLNDWISSLNLGHGKTY